MLVTGSKAAILLGVHQNTLRKMAKAGKIEFIWVNGKRKYNVEKFMQSKIEAKTDRKYICYCRVSTAKQRDDLDRQVEFMREKYPDYTIITDIGSGINFKRKGFTAILEQVMQGNVAEIVVAHRDRLCRFGFELVQWICNKNATKLVVFDSEKLSPTEELTKDLLSIITIFSCRVNGLRKYSNKIKKDKTLSNQKAGAKT